ncbi:retrovirus-related pol polyprotein from transposon TNT 1-94 [Tanacetum coccineum]
MKDPIAIEEKQNLCTIDYKKLNALYEDFVPQKELSAQQKYFPSSFISSENSSNASSSYSSSETKPTVTPIPSANPMLVDLNQMETDFKTLFELLQTNFKREIIFYTPSEEIRLTNFCQQQVKPILHKLHWNFDIFQKRFLKDIKEMKDVFVSTKNDLSETWKQNKLLKDQLLEKNLKHKIECCVLLSHECVENKMQDEINKIQRDSIEIQDGMQKRINILENDVQICQKQSLDFELQLQHEKERRKCESSLKSVCETSWISKMEKFESVNVSLEFQVQSLLKERENVKTENHKLFDSIKRTRTQTQGEINELIEHVNQKTYAYADVSAQNQDLLISISELKAKLKNVEKVKVSDRSNNKPDVASKNVALDKKIVTNADIKNTLIAKNVLYVTYAKNVLIPCHDDCLAKYKLNVHSKVRRALFTTSRIAKSKFKDPTPVILKTRFSIQTIQSKSLDTTPVVSKTKIIVVTPLSAKYKVVQIVLWIVDSGCSKHMTGDRTLLKNFIEKFMGTVRFGNDHFAAITGYGDYVQGNITACHVYYVKGLGYNLFRVGQFCDSDLEVAFCSKTCYVRNLEGDDLLIGDCESYLLSHLNFGTINDLTKHDLVDGLLKFKYSKYHLCFACERGKRKKASHPPKLVPISHSKLELLHMDLCGPMQVASINGKRYILLIVNDCSRFTWVYILLTKDETPEIIKNFIARVQLNYNTKVYKIRTNNGTEFKNATLKAHYDKLGIMQQFSIARTPQQNGVVERRNRTLVEVARTMLIFSRLPEFLWAEAVSTACFTQNRSIIHTRYNKTPYELLHGRKPNVEYFSCVWFIVLSNK